MSDPKTRSAALSWTPPVDLQGRSRRGLPPLRCEEETPSSTGTATRTATAWSVNAEAVTPNGHSSSEASSGHRCRPGPRPHPGIRDHNHPSGAEAFSFQRNGVLSTGRLTIARKTSFCEADERRKGPLTRREATRRSEGTFAPGDTAFAFGRRSALVGVPHDGVMSQTAARRDRSARRDRAGCSPSDSVSWCRRPAWCMSLRPRSRSAWHATRTRSWRHRATRPRSLPEAPTEIEARQTDPVEPGASGPRTQTRWSSG